MDQYTKCGKYHYIILKCKDGYFGEVVLNSPDNVIHTTPIRKKAITIERLCSRYVSKQILKKG